MSGWWHRATREEKLAQVKAAHELGLSARHVAKNCGVPESTVATMARYYGIPLTHDAAEYFGDRSAFFRRVKRGRTSELKEAFLSGEPVDFWSAK